MLGSKGAIFDEIQHVPALLSYLQAETDKQQIKGQFVITGSYNLILNGVSNTITGRSCCTA
jgi:hypothetical protein